MSQNFTCAGRHNGWKLKRYEKTNVSNGGVGPALHRSVDRLQPAIIHAASDSAGHQRAGALNKAVRTIKAGGEAIYFCFVSRLDFAKTGLS
jgi:hypothetical protein